MHHYILITFFVYGGKTKSMLAEEASHILQIKTRKLKDSFQYGEKKNSNEKGPCNPKKTKLKNKIHLPDSKTLSILRNQNNMY